MESGLQTANIRIDSDILRVGSCVQLQHAMLQEIRSGIHIVQWQDNHIVGEATDLVNEIRQEVVALSKGTSNN